MPTDHRDGGVSQSILIGIESDMVNVCGVTSNFMSEASSSQKPNKDFGPFNAVSFSLHALDYFLTGYFAMGWKAAEKLIRHWKILRGDNVMIIRGKDKGETGTIKRVIRSQNRVIVEGKNLIKKHIKGGPDHEGGIFTVEAPLHASNVQVVDPVTGRPCKVGVKYLEDGTKVRVARGTGTSGSIIPRPEILKIRTTPRPTTAGPKDTPMEFVWEQTYDAKTGKGMPDL
ncbi:KOW domain-containing protein [Raphanus sativus]|nr:KOW domain-containing protein [Raphanus sativus]